MDRIAVGVFGKSCRRTHVVIWSMLLFGACPSAMINIAWVRDDANEFYTRNVKSHSRPLITHLGMLRAYADVGV